LYEWFRAQQEAAIFDEWGCGVRRGRDSPLEQLLGLAVQHIRIRAADMQWEPDFGRKLFMERMNP
jgi:hypothetical protein